MRRSITIFSALALFLHAGCAAHRVTRDPDVTRSAVIFIPGYKGSTLKKAGSDETVWVDAPEILFGSRSLALEGKDAGIENQVIVSPDGLFRAFPVIPFVYRYSFYDDWIRFLDEHLPHDTEIIALGYDWRLDNAKNARLLSDTVEKLRARGITDIDVIAHSMGGLILAYYLRYGAQEPSAARETWEGAARVRKAVFAATPFRGSITILRDIQRGNPTIMNKELLSRDTLGTFFSTYQLMPPPADRPIFGRDGEPLLIDTYAPEIWERYRWGFLCADLTASVREVRKEIIRSRLDSARLFSSLINHEGGGAPPSPSLASTEYLLFVGEGRRTAAHALFDRDECPGLLFTDDTVSKNLPCLDESHFYENGDGLVTTRSSALPDAYQSRLKGDEIHTSDEHGEFFDNPAVRDAILRFLNPERGLLEMAQRVSETFAPLPR